MGMKPRKLQAGGYRPKGDLIIDPCLLVTGTINVNRAVNYNQSNFSKHENDDGSEDAFWDGHRRYQNREETKEADRVYSRARYKVYSLCTHTAVGYVAPLEKENEIREALREAAQTVDEANAKFRHCHIDFALDVAHLRVAGEGTKRALAKKITEATAKIQASLENFKVDQAQKVLADTAELVAVLKNGKVKKQLTQAREQAKELATEIAQFVRDYDGKLEAAMRTAEGKQFLRRAGAVWNF